MAHLEAFPRLGSLDLSANHLRGAGLLHLAHLTARERLDRRYDRFGDETSAGLAGLTALRASMVALGE